MGFRLRLLLDTHALIWWLAGDEALSRRARDAIADEANEIIVSAASAMEIATKFRIGKLPGAAVLVPMALTIPALCVALFSPVAGWLSDKLGRKRLLITALVGYAGFGLLPLLLDDLRMILAARVALGVKSAVQVARPAR